jgi:hypothetical protein
MTALLQNPTQDAIRTIRGIRVITIVWMSLAAAVSLSAAWMARSPALLAFGGYSAIELSSAVVSWRFRAHATQEHVARRTAHTAGASLLVLAFCVVVASTMTLVGHSKPKPTYLGIAILIATAAIMPWLAKEKRRLLDITGSAALKADAAESALCAYLSLIALFGLAANAIWHVAWADPVAAFSITQLIVLEAREAIRGKPRGCE